ncbi:MULTISPECIES: PEP/pyruvate-binding domain-containing protein [Actinomadura]|uniref:PEP/pyruvate-binding domain-containing protein n=1 Tax=Actinomadura yumaensis TaxID=111807 RepID=A0ABW2CDZ1_9ACTN|nr:PEP/pyruvate-binding domain-containing protein [Actinomadura sp. J1-007]MWK34432.1 pyruvate, phosphate dikinase [Actinomadura sp. J1-007]
MTGDRERPYVLDLDAAEADLATVGGKGASLARLAREGLPVPAGFHVTTDAYRHHVDSHGLRERIDAALADVDPDRPETAERAAERIGALFARHEPPDDLAGPIRWAYAALGDRYHPLAVRSSATAEDRAARSSAGQHDSFLGVRGEAALLAAVRDCWASLWTARAIGYRARHGGGGAGPSIAVTVQTLVAAESAGVMFTVAPVSGSSDQVVLNAAWGLGDAVTGGRVTPDALVVDKETGLVAGRRVSEKTVMSVLTLDGLRDEPVPPERRGEAVLTAEAAGELARLGVRIERLYGRGVDVEWAWADGRPYVVQARPITSRTAERPDPGGHATEVWNDSLAADRLWSSGDLGEAIPDVMTPCTRSLVEIFMAGAMAPSSLPGLRAYGVIGGRFYTDLSMAAAIAHAFGARSRLGALERDYGRLPPGMRVPRPPVSRLDVIRALAPAVLDVTRRVPLNRRRLPAFLEESPARCDALRGRFASTDDPRDLANLWRDEVLPFFTEACHMLEAAMRQDGRALTSVPRYLERRAGERDADAMLSGLRHPRQRLAALGPVTGLARVARGELDAGAYLQEWGHRSPHEFEVSTPRPAEDPAWLDRQVEAVRASARASGEDATDLSRRQLDTARAAWDRFRSRRPRRVGAARRRVGRYARAVHDREAARSEVARAFWVLRAFVLRAGELTGRGEELFQLTIHEILAVLGGDDRPLERVAVRRRTYDRYRALPSYPPLIRGRFDPFAWATDPERRTDFYDATGRADRAARDREASSGGLVAVPDDGGSAAQSGVMGFPGAAGVAEGTVRVLASPEDGDLLRPGEVLVTAVTNAGWSPLFPRAAAIVTDVGGPLSHAAIVARELGIPAVVGCGDATMRLSTGDRVRVDGEHGAVDPVRDRPQDADRAREPGGTRDGAAGGATGRGRRPSTGGSPRRGATSGGRREARG